MVDRDLVAGGEFAAEEGAGEGIFDFVLDGVFERASAEDWVETEFSEFLFGEVV